MIWALGKRKLKSRESADLKSAIVALVPASTNCLIDCQRLDLLQGEIRGEDAADVLAIQLCSTGQRGELGACICRVGQVRGWLANELQAQTKVAIKW